MQSLRLLHRHGNNDSVITSQYTGLLRHSAVESLHKSANPTVIVMGSTTTTLLIEALVQAEMLPRGLFGDSGKHHQPRPVVVRTDRWSRVTEIATRLNCCLVVTTEEPEGEAARLRNAVGRSVTVLHADELLATACRSLPSTGAGDSIGNRIIARLQRRWRQLPGAGILRERPAPQVQLAGSKPTR